MSQYSGSQVLNRSSDGKVIYRGVRDPNQSYIQQNPRVAESSRLEYDARIENQSHQIRVLNSSMYSQHSITSNKKRQENRHIRWDQKIIDQDSDNDENEPQNDSIISKTEKKVNKFLEFFAEYGVQFLATILIGAVLIYALSYAIFYAKNYMKAALKNQDATGA